MDGYTRYIYALIGALVVGITGCAPDRPPGAAPSTERPAPAINTPARLALATNAIQIADDLVSDENQLRNPLATPEAIAAAARREQLAYRAIGRHLEWDAVIRPRIPASLLDSYDRNVSARRNLNELAPTVDTLPPWRIVPPASADELSSHYREAQAQSGVGWNYLAAINLVETGFGRIASTSTAGAQGPMQFLPATFAAHGDGGNILSTRDSIMAAGRYLAANGFSADPGRAIWHYNHADEYVTAVTAYAAVMAADPAAFGIYHRWSIYYFTTAGDVLLPEGFAQTSRIPAAGYLATHPQ